MIYESFEQLQIHISSNGKKTVVVVCPDISSLTALKRCFEEELLDAVFVGDRKTIEDLKTGFGTCFDHVPVIHADDLLGAAYEGVRCINRGEGDFLLKGRIDTALLLKAVVDKESVMRTGNLMTHLAFFKIPNYHKLIVLTDSGMVMNPTLAQKKQIIENAVNTLRKMGYEKPKVGVLAAVEKINPKMPETLDANELHEMNQRGEIQDCIVEGPYSYDILMSKRSAAKKGITSELAGDPDILLVDKMSTGNILGKALVFSAEAEMAGIVVGAKVPIALTSRGATEAEKYLSLLLAKACI